MARLTVAPHRYCLCVVCACIHCVIYRYVYNMCVKVRNTRLLINIHEPFFVFLFSVQQDATETW